MRRGQGSNQQRLGRPACSVPAGALPRRGYGGSVIAAATSIPFAFVTRKWVGPTWWCSDSIQLPYGCIITYRIGGEDEMANSGITDDLRAILAENLTPSGAITTPERLI